MLIGNSWIHGTSLFGAVSVPVLLVIDFLEDDGLTRDWRDSYKNGISDSIETRLSNSYLIGEIFGMLFFGALIDRVGRRTGVWSATAILVLGIVLATAAHGTTQHG